jgi:Tat protein secretion system quality control protein TatD with DNase activity
MRPESANLLRSLPADRIFLETDGADIEIRDIYNKVSTDLDLTVDKLKTTIISNYRTFFKVNP